jgi:hypothetical protein
MRILSAFGTYGCRSWPKALTKLLAVTGLLILLVAAALWTAEDRYSVNYSKGLIRNRVHVFAVPVYQTTRPIFESQRETKEAGEWRLMISKGIFGHRKQETTETTVASALRMTLQAISLAGGVSTDARQPELMDAAWDAAKAGDAEELKSIRERLD